MAIEKTGINHSVSSMNELAGRKVGRAQDAAARMGELQSAKKPRKDSICLSGQAVPPAVTLQDVKGEILKSLTEEKPLAELIRISEVVQSNSYKPQAETIASAMLGISEEDA